MSFAIVAAGVTAAGAVGGAVISSNAAKSAANTQANAANSASQVQQNEFNTINNEQAPSRNLGYGAENILASLFGIADPTAAGTASLYPGANPGATTGSPTSLPNAGSSTSGGAATTGTGGATGTAASATGTANNPNYSSFYNSPGYQFTLQQGEQAINRSASASGNLYSTATLGALNNYAQGAASTQYNNYVQQLMSMAGLGQGAANTTSQAATNTGNNISANTLSAGNANASGILGQAGAFNSAISGVTGAVNGQQSNLLTALQGGSNAGGYNLGAGIPSAGAGSSLVYDGNGNIVGTTSGTGP